MLSSGQLGQILFLPDLFIYFYIHLLLHVPSIDNFIYLFTELFLPKYLVLFHSSVQLLFLN